MVSHPFDQRGLLPLDHRLPSAMLFLVNIYLILTLCAMADAQADVPGPRTSTVCSGRKVVNATVRGVPIESNILGSTYLNNLDCQWMLYAPTNHHLKLNFTSFSTFFSDVLSVYDGPTDSSRSLATISGVRKSPPVVFVGSPAFVSFTTDATITFPGFQAVVYAVPGPKPLTVCEGRKVINVTVSGVPVESNSLGTRYTRNLDCSWILKAPANHHVQLNFTSFHLSLFHSLRVFDGFTALVARYWSIEIPLPAIAAGSFAFLKFTTDSGDVYPGFQAVAYAVAGPAPFQMCRGRQVIFATGRGVPIASNAPNLYYVSYLNCSWALTAPANHYLRINFNSFNLNKEGGFVRVYDGPSQSSPMIEFSGIRSPPMVVKTGSQALVEFTSSFSSRAGTGFQAVVYAVRGPKPELCGGRKVINATVKGVQFSSNPLGQTYSSILDCQWIIWAPAKHYLRINITALDTPFEQDCLSIQDISSSCLSGRLGPDIWVIDGNAMVKFKATSSGASYSGFQAVVYAVPRAMCGGRKALNVTVSGVKISPCPFDLHYDDNLRCQWILKAPTNHRLRMNITWFSTEPSADILRVYDGFTRLVAELSGGPVWEDYGGTPDFPEKIEVGSLAFLEFTSDSDNPNPNVYGRFKGFEIIAFAVPISTQRPTRTRRPNGVSNLSIESPAASSTSTSGVPIAMVVGSVMFVACALVISAAVIIRKRQAPLCTHHVVQVRPRGTSVVQTTPTVLKLLG